MINRFELSRRPFLQRFPGIIFLISIAICIFSCKTTQPKQYVEGPYDADMLKQIPVPDPIIQKGDMLSIIVYSDNPANTLLYNQPMGAGAPAGGSGTSTSGGGQSSGGYLVDNDGNIQFQSLGSLHVEGLTKNKLVDLLNSKLKDTFLSNPYYSIRFLNYKVTLIGEVSRPGVYNIPAERVNLLEAIGLAGDVTVYGRRDEVLVVREVNGQRQIGKLNLSDPNIFKSPYYNLEHNDIIAVASNKYKNRQKEDAFFKYFSVAISVISATAIIITVLK